MNTTYTDTQLQLALAKMLPETLHIAEGTTNCFKWSKNKNYPRNIVLDTEWLHVCWLVEKTLTDSKWAQYRTTLIKQVSLSVMPDTLLLLTDSRHASWQQRAIALAKVKGMEIV